jgi:hypothetical protein
LLLGASRWEVLGQMVTSSVRQGGLLHAHGCAGDPEGAEVGI